MASHYLEDLEIADKEGCKWNNPHSGTLKLQMMITLNLTCTLNDLPLKLRTCIYKGIRTRHSKIEGFIGFR